jgi:hypothetical protein
MDVTLSPTMLAPAHPFGPFPSDDSRGTEASEQTKAHPRMPRILPQNLSAGSLTHLAGLHDIGVT